MTETQEQKAARLFKELESMFEGEGDYKTLKSRVEKLWELFGDEENPIDLKQVEQQLDEMKAFQETVTKSIRAQRRGLYVPGIEDEEFSLQKAIIGARTGNWKQFDAEKEHEIMKQVQAKAAQIMGDDAAGGFFVPDQVIAEVIGAIYSKSAFINLSGEGTQRVSVMDGLKGVPVKINKFEGGLVAYWIGEEDEYAESRATAGEISMTPKKLGILVRMTDSMRRFAAPGFEKQLRTDFIRAAAKKLDWTIAYGTGSDNMPLGIANHPDVKLYNAADGASVLRKNVATITDWPTGPFDFDDLDNMDLLLEEADIEIDETHATISSPRFFSWLKQQKIANFSAQSSEQPYLIGMPMLSDARLMDLIGEYGKTTQIASNNIPAVTVNGPTTNSDAKHTDVFRGNLGDVILGRWGGVEIDTDDGKGKGFTSDQTYTKLRMYADTAYRYPEAITMCPNALVRA